MLPNSNGSGGFVFTYYDPPQVPTVFSSGSHLVNPPEDQNMYNIYTASKIDNQNVDAVMMEQHYGQIPNNIQFPPNSIGTGANEFANVMANTGVSHLGQESTVSGSQPIQIISQIPPTMSGVQVISVDSEGQPLYGNYGDIQSLLVACQQQSAM